MADFNNMVPGESCFNLNFSNPGGSFGPPMSLNSESGGGDGSESSSQQGSSSGTSRNGHHGRNLGAAGKLALVAAKGLPNGKKTKGRVKIKMEFIDNKLRRYTTFSKRKTGIMKKAYELSTLTGTQVMLLVASETGHVYTFATKKLQPMITSEAGKALIQTCLNSPEPAGGDGLEGSFMETGVSFHTTEIPPSNAMGGRANAKGRGRARNNNQNLYDDDGAKGSSPKSFYGGALPTMVPPTSAFGIQTPGSASGGMGASDEDDSDDDDDTSPEGTPVAASSPSDRRTASAGAAAAELQQQLSDNANAMKAAQQQAVANAVAAQMLFPGANLTGSNPFSSLMSGGTVMYQVPQGVVYAAPTSVSNAGFMFGLSGANGTADANANNAAAATGAQSLITIPLSLSSYQQMVSAASQQSSGAESGGENSDAD